MSELFIDAPVNGTMTGELNPESAEFVKALSMGNDVTDVAKLEGGGALRLQSLDTIMMATIQSNRNMVLFNKLATTNATAPVDEWTEQSSIGGFLGGATNTELGDIPAAMGQYNRRSGKVKYLMTRAEVSVVAQVSRNMVEAVAIEQQAAALRLLSDAEFLCFHGDENVVETEFSGIYAQLEAGINAGQLDPDNIVDAHGEPMRSIEPISQAAQQIATMGNYGQATDVFLPFECQTDLDTGLLPAYRVPLPVGNGGTTQGSPVIGIRTSYGDIATNPDLFIPGESQLLPFEVKNGAIAINNNFKPVSVGVEVDDAVDSAFGKNQDGNYYYLVTGVNNYGQSMGFITTQTAIGLGEAATLTIDASVSGSESGYAIYRSRKNGTSASNDFRLIRRIPRTGASTKFVDLNREIPGTSKAYVLSMKTGENAITWRQFMPMSRFDLFPTSRATKPWAQLLMGYLRIAKRRQHVVIKNILPSQSKWRPFSDEPPKYLMPGVTTYPA